MNYVAFSPHFPPNYEMFTVRLNQAGLNVLGLGDTPFEKLSPALKENLRGYYQVSDMHNYDEVRRAMDYFSQKFGRLDWVESHNEYWLECEASLRSDYDIQGPKKEDIARVKRKSLMKEIYSQAGIEVARGRIVRDTQDAINFIEEVGYPVVAKPDKGVGAASTYKIEDAEQLDHFFNHKPEGPFLMEEFIQGQIVSFDGLTDQDGEVVFYTVNVFRQGVMETVNQNLDFFYYSLREVPEILVDIGLRTVEAFNIRARFFHLEYFYTNDERVVALEVNMRPPGGLTTDMYNYANDFDIYAEYANVLKENQFYAEVKRKYFCAYLGRKHYINYILPHAQLLEKFSNLIVHHQPVEYVLRDALGDYAYILRSAQFNDILNAEEGILAARQE